ncbi:sugar phosphate isomerase/epimerase family protein [Actinomadura atramentaria]|uniref:sugar phosphate isomerase/epimerase family protein n=1 Tax=Actinomadura atramentaria TaxID=1990 RepID=UPI00035DA106|nr:TIM barrel protein [Actinomadura atramentaria]
MTNINPDPARRCRPSVGRSWWERSVDQATAGYDVPLPAFARGAGAAGFAALEVAAHHVAAAERTLGTGPLQHLLDAAGVRIARISCGTGVPADLTVPAAAWPQALRRWNSTCALAARYRHHRAELTVFVPRPASPGAGLDAATLTRRALELARAAAAHGIALHVEIHDPFHLARAGWLWESWRAAEPAATPKLLVDTATYAVVFDDPATAIGALPVGSVGWVQVADVVFDAAQGPPRRVLPGTGQTDWAGVLHACAAVGYHSALSVEVPCAAVPRSAARTATGGSLRGDSPQPHMESDVTAELLRRAAAALTAVLHSVDTGLETDDAV